MCHFSLSECVLLGTLDDFGLKILLPVIICKPESSEKVFPYFFAKVKCHHRLGFSVSLTKETLDHFANDSAPLPFVLVYNFLVLITKQFLWPFYLDKENCHS